MTLPREFALALHSHAGGVYGGLRFAHGFTGVSAAFCWFAASAAARWKSLCSFYVTQRHLGTVPMVILRGRLR